MLFGLNILRDALWPGSSDNFRFVDDGFALIDSIEEFRNFLGDLAG